MSITLLRGPKGVLFGFVTPSTKVRSSRGWIGLSLCAVINHQRRRPCGKIMASRFN